MTIARHGRSLHHRRPGQLPSGAGTGNPASCPRRKLVHLTNRFGSSPVTFGHVTAGLKGAGASLEAGTVRQVTVEGNRSVTIPAGKDVVSDPVRLTIRAFQPVAISYYSPKLTLLPTEPLDKNVRYPDFLQKRLTKAGIPLTTVNAGISGNRLLQPGLVPQFGPKAISRITRDAANIPGATNATILIGINDLGQPPAPTTQQMKQGYITVIQALKAKKIHVMLGTIVPSGRALLDGPLVASGLEATRQELNEWIRTQHVSDGFVDFDKAMRSPTNPKILNPVCASGDDLHPNALDYQAMARAMPLRSLKTSC